MRTVNFASGGTVSTGSIVFEGGTDELREYVEGLVVRAAVVLRSKLPVVVRAFVSEEKITALAEWAFDRVWPAHRSAPPVPEVT